MVLSILENILYITISIGLLYGLIAMIITLVKLKRKRSFSDPFSWPGISILKPLKGKDDQLEENLRSFFNLDYPNYEIIFGLADPADPAIEVVKKLRHQFPHIRTKIVINSRQVGLNPKINNLQNIFPQSGYEYILISDSNVRVRENYLKENMKLMLKPGTGLVTSTIRGTTARAFGSVMENLHLNTFIASTVFSVPSLFHKAVVIGKSMLLKKRYIERMGGFSPFADYLAEDHLIGVGIKKSGLGIIHSAHMIDNINEKWKLERFVNRHVRWAKMRSNLNCIHYMAEILANPVMLAFIYAVSTFSTTGWLIFLMVAVIKTITDAVIAQSMHSDLHWYHYFLLPLKDILIGIIWLTPFVNRRVEWRGNVFKITRGTKLIPLA